jgi:hypothetical protein
MTPATAPYMGLTVAFTNPAAHGKPEYLSPAVIQTILPDGAVSLNVLQNGNIRYIASAVKGTGPGEWSFLTS